MYITIITFGSRGDVQPYLALGRGLQRRGHTVQVVTHAAFAEMVKACGLLYSPIDTGKQELFQTGPGQQLLESDGLRLLHHYAQSIRPLITPTMARCWHVCQGTDAIISSFQGLPYGGAIAEKLHLPLAVAGVQPNQLPTQAFADPGFAHAFRPKDRSPKLLNYGSHILAHAIFWEIFLPEINRARKRLLNLPPLPVWVPWQSLSEQADLLLLGYSACVLPRPIEWNERTVVTGYWFLDNQQGWLPPGELVQFVQADPPPVYIGFGSMNTLHPERLTHLVWEALQRSHQRGVLLTGGGALHQVRSSEQLYTVDSVPHEWLFPRMAAVVHHGGAGTTGAGLRAGVPSVIVSFLPEQAFWGAQVFQLGAGPRPLVYRTLTASDLAQAIEHAVYNPSLRAQALSLGKQIRAEQGVVQAVETFERVIVREGTRRNSKKRQHLVSNA